MEVQENGVWVSWNENKKHPYEKLFVVENEQELQQVIDENNNIRLFGNKQSSADIVAGTDVVVDIRKYNNILNYNTDLKQITVQSGIRLSELIDAVENMGWCIPCLPDINTITVGGALATGTHGTSGQLLSDYVTCFRIILANGTIKEIDQTDKQIEAFRVSLGALGVISTITFQCEDIYTLHIKETPQKDHLWIQNLKEKLQKHDFLRILWLPHTGYGYVITGDKIPKNTAIKTITGPKYLKHRRNTSAILYKKTHLFPWFTSIANKIIQKLFFNSIKEHKGSLYQATVTKSRGSTLELAEWTINIDDFPKVFKELKQTINSYKNNAFIHIPMDIRFIYKENSWLSYSYGKDVVTMGCVCRNTFKADTYEAFEVIENIFLKYGGRPHWAKRFKITNNTFEKIYPKWNDFKALRQKLDPTNKFLNPYLKKIFNE